MIISRNQVQNIMKIYGKDMNSNRIDNVKDAGAVTKKDELSISGESKIMQKAMQAAKQAPDIRWDKVKELQVRMNMDNFDVSDEEIAEKLIERALVDELI